MKAGRKAIHKFNTIEVGQRCELVGSAAKWPYQYIGRLTDKKFKIEREGKKIFAVRVTNNIKL
jgi:hypothetical protein